MNSTLNNSLIYTPFMYHEGQANPPDNQSPRILIVEDEMIVAMDLAYSLENDGYHIIGLVKDGQDAVAIAVHTQPDIIIMDIDLPGKMDGIAAARLIQKKILTKIIFASGHCDVDPRIQKIIEEEIHPFIRKPYYREALRKILSEI